MTNPYEFLGPVKAGAKIIEDTGFDTLNANSVFIKRQLILVLDETNSIPLANPEYLEFSNSVEGREVLKTVRLDKNLIDAIMLVWGDKPTVVS